MLSQSTTVKNVAVKRTSNEKAEATVYLSTKADGTKLQPCVVSAGEKFETVKLQTEFTAKCSITTPVNGSINDKLILLHLNKANRKVFYLVSTL